MSGSLVISMTMLCAACVATTTPTTESAETTEATENPERDNRSTASEETGLESRLPAHLLVALAASCPAPNHCDTSFGSLSTWSAWTDCGSPSCETGGCCLNHCTVEANARLQDQFRFQSRKNIFGQECIEIEIRTQQTSCGLTQC